MAQTTINILPNEILAYIINKLSPRDATMFGATDSVLRDIYLLIRTKILYERVLRTLRCVTHIQLGTRCSRIIMSLDTDKINFTYTLCEKGVIVTRYSIWNFTDTSSNKYNEILYTVHHGIKISTIIVEKPIGNKVQIINSKLTPVDTFPMIYNC